MHASAHKLTKSVILNVVKDIGTASRILHYVQDDSREYLIPLTPVAGNFGCQMSHLAHLWRMHPSSDQAL